MFLLQPLDLVQVVLLHLRDFFLELFDHIATIGRQLFNLLFQILYFFP